MPPEDPPGRNTIRFAEPNDAELILVRLLGQGVKATVYLAQEPALRRLVAVKILSSELAASEVARARFQREAEAAAKISHPNVATVHRVGHLADGVPFLVMPYVRGPNLAQRLIADGARPLEETRSVLVSVASALEAAHAQGIVHRDVCAENVLFDETTGRVLLTDFGLAGVLESGDAVVERLTRSGEIIGHPGYQSKEQRLGGPITPRTDVYGLGVLGLALLNGSPPRGGSPAALESALTEAAQVDPDLARHIRRWVAPDPEHRPAIGDVLRHLHELGREGPSRVWSLPIPPQVRRIAQVVAGVGGGGWILLEFVDQLEGRGMIGGVVYDLALPTVLAALSSALVLAWFHGPRGKQPVRIVEIALLALISVVWLLIVVTVLARGVG